MPTLKRTIHTDLYTPKAQEILYRVKLFMKNKWGSSQMARNATLASSGTSTTLRLTPTALGALSIIAVRLIRAALKTRKSVSG